MSASVTISNTFASQSGPIPLSQLDANFTQLASAVNSTLNFTNYAADSGTANAYAVTFSSPATVSYTAGLTISFKATNANTTASTLNVNSLGTKSIVTPSGGALTSGMIAAGQVATVVYDGTNFQLQSVAGAGGSAGGSNTQIQFNSSGALAGSASLTWDGTYLTAGSIKDTALTSGRVTYAGAAGLLQDSANLTFDGTTLTANALTTTSTVTINGGTANGVAYLNGSKVLTTGSALVFDGTNLGIGTSSPSAKLEAVTASGFAGRFSSSSGTGQQEIIRVTNSTNGSYFSIVGVGSASAIPSWSNNSIVCEVVPSGSGNYIISAYSGNLLFQTNGRTTQATLDTSGNLGLGVTPSAWGSGGKAVELPQGAGLYGFSSTTNLLQNAYYNGTNWIYKTTAAASLAQVTQGQHIWFNAPSGTAGTAISFTQAMTLDSSGNLLVGTTSTGTTNSTSITLEKANGYMVVNHISGTATGAGYAIFGYNGTLIGSITQSGTTAVLYNVTSDQRLKDNIADADSASSLIDSIKVRQFDWKADGSHQRYGFIAQELLPVAPEAVHQPQDPDDMMAVDYSKLVPMLVKEIQDLRARISVLENK